MSTVDLVIRGGKVVSADRIMEASVAIDGEHIVAVGHDDAMPTGRHDMRADGLYLLPGAIDCHVHFRDPGYPNKETWKSGSAAAACGGVTTVFEMPNTNPPTGTIEALNLKLRAAEQSYVDFGIHGLLGDDSVAHLEQLLEGGVTSFKAFVGNTFGNLPAPSDGALLEGFEKLAPLGVRTVVHAENSPIMARRQRLLAEAGRIDTLAHLAARPAVCEIEAVGRVIAFAEWTGARVHIAHHSAADSLFVVRDAKRRGVDVTVETCPQYLLLNTDDMLRLGGITRLNPPIREPRHNQPLWDALLDGTIDMIATDHAPHTPEEKTRESIWDCDCGFPGGGDADGADADRGESRTRNPDGLRALERGQPRARLGPVGQQRRNRKRPARRHRVRRHGPARHAVAKPAAFAQQDFAVARPRRAGLSAAHPGARPVRDARRQAGDRSGRLGPLGQKGAADAESPPAQHRALQQRDPRNARRGAPERVAGRGGAAMTKTLVQRVDVHCVACRGRAT